MPPSCPSIRLLLGLLVGMAGCGPQRGSADDEATGPASLTDGASGPGTANSGSTDATGVEPTPTTDGPTSGTPTSGEPTTSAPTSGDPPSEPGPQPAGTCPPGWDFPAGLIVTLKIAAPEADFDGEFEAGTTYPDGTAAVCITWDGDKMAGARLAFGPAVGDTPQHLLELVLSDGERTYGTSMSPAEPGAYDGFSVRHTVTGAGGVARTYDFAADQGIGLVEVPWIPRVPGHYIVASAKLQMPNDGAGAQVGFEILLITGGSNVDPTQEFCETIDHPFKCGLTSCAWLETERVTLMATCELAPVGLCVWEFAATNDPAYDSTFFRVVDDGVDLRRVGGEACDLHGAEHPLGWTECSGGPGDAQQCACVCVGGTCPGDAALALLEGCALPQPCPDADHEGGDGWAPTEDCLYTALGADAPAVLRVHQNLGDPDLDDRVYLHGDGTAAWLHGACDLGCIGSCDDRDWSVPRRCTLQQPAFFAACAATSDPDELAACRDVAAWFTDCTVKTPTCP